MKYQTPPIDIDPELVVQMAVGTAVLVALVYLFIAFDMHTWPRRFREWLWERNAKFWIVLLSIGLLTVCPFLALISAHAGWLAFGSAVTLLIIAAIIDEERSYAKTYGYGYDNNNWPPENQRSYRNASYGYGNNNTPRKQPDEGELPAP